MSRVFASALGIAVLALAACHGSGYAVRPIPRIAADSVGKPVSRLREAFGEPRKIESTPTKEVFSLVPAANPRRRSGRLPRLRDGSDG